MRALTKSLTGATSALVSIIALAACTPSTEALPAQPTETTAPVTSLAAGPTASPTATANADAERGQQLSDGAAEFDAAAAAFLLPLPAGHAWPSGADLGVYPGYGEDTAWRAWIGANAVAARAGDAAAASALASADIPFQGGFGSDIRAAIAAEDYRTLLKMFPDRGLLTKAFDA